MSDPVTGQPLDLRTSDGVTSLYVLDGIGNPTASIADTGKIAYQVTYDAYGAETVTKGGSSTQWQQNPYGYKTGLRSSNSDSGLTKFGYRWFSATTGSWAERDTLDVPLDPSNANRYAFVGCDPINESDPTGTATGCSIAAAVFGGVGILAGGAAFILKSIATAGTLDLLIGALGAVSFATGAPGALLTAKSLSPGGC